MQGSPKAESPEVLSYLALRKAVGIVAVTLPFVLAIPWGLLRHMLQSSISAYYYTGMRNIFVGSLCAIAMFQLACRGFPEDEIASILAAIFALGVAFFPTAPENATPQQKLIGGIHYTFAALLFLTLAYFCLVLFRKTDPKKRETRQKLKRNRVYTVSGYVILASIVLLGTLKLAGIDTLPGGIGTAFFFETTSLLAFGAAWLVKGETIFKDEPTPETVKGIAAGG